MPETTICAPGVRVRDLLPEAKLFGADDLVVHSCSSDSRSCRDGDLFAALVGVAVDGHDFAHDAVASGAAAVLVERYLPLPGVTQCIVPDTRVAFGRICQALAGNPSRAMHTIGVTGTSGKTSTCWLLASIFEAAGLRAGFTGTIVNCDSDAIEASRMTTPPAPVLADWLARMSASGCSHAVVEVSSHALAQARTAGIEFDAACVTNVRRDHLDFHTTLQNYRDAKGRLLSQVRAGGCTALNADDSVCNRYLSQFDGPALTFGMQGEAAITATIVERHLSEQTFLLHAGADTAAVRTRIIGEQHVYNCLAAATLGLVYGLDLNDIVRGLERLEKIPGRMERIECGQPFGVFVDYAHTPDALAAVVCSLRQVTPGKLICVFGAGGERDRAKRPLMAQAVESSADLCVVTDDNPRCEDPGAIRHDILRGFGSMDRVVVSPDRSEAITWALGQAGRRDCVLIAGKGHEDFQIVGSHRRWFDDREIARNWLYEHGGPAIDLAGARRRAG